MKHKMPTKARIWPAPDPATRVVVPVSAGEPLPAPLSMPVAPSKVRVRPVAVDLPSLTGQLGEVLAELRHEYGMAYRTRTWIEEMLPVYGAQLDDPVLARAVLAVAALDAGGIRADVSGLLESHGKDEIIATGKVVLAALNEVRAACDGSGHRFAVPVRPSDPSRWPALVS